jgi:hypothetical protein
MAPSLGPATARSGALQDRGPATDYRTQNGETALIRRVVTGAKGTITFLITIPLDGGTGGEPWTITSGTKSYTKRTAGPVGCGQLYGQPGHLRAQRNRISSPSIN